MRDIDFIKMVIVRAIESRKKAISEASMESVTDILIKVDELEALSQALNKLKNL